VEGSSCFGMEASFDLLYTAIKTIGIYGNTGISLWNSALNSGFRLFRHGISIVEMCFQLSFTKMDAQSVDKLSRRRTAKLTIPPSSDSRPLVYHSDHQALSTA